MELLPAERYNYVDFVAEVVHPMLRFEASPRLGTKVPDFELLTLDETPTRLSHWWANREYLVVEFGSFT